ncbi:hypothetical protein LEP1GSC137_4322 [Leptospira borgpetersenii str. Noumea 25]|nr:hypothetical protein LEP1GSC137_4322 [Leptospira borgpetersenii str. Noumea 25]
MLFSDSILFFIHTSLLRIHISYLSQNKRTGYKKRNSFFEFGNLRLILLQK